ncbi:HPr(Ser) kinase/phosphatase [Rubeoparvulum massiliense]|uniref:HPr(Ser) kinase/phosphatase n=1 Tax=Rubeoparvulum massiliense TaxID=1631346 RepID=UPI00065E1F3A|nr:HPr(Ser) kinase/phosphatase [Rubeoparvulum massiliense]
MSQLFVKDVVEQFSLKVVAGHRGLARPIKHSDINRPGIELAGYFDYYPQEYVQLLGMTECSFIQTLSEALQMERFQILCGTKTPFICICHGMEVPALLIEAAERSGVPLLCTPISTTKMVSKLANYLEGRLAPSTTLHGVLVDVYGMGILLMGKSGIGKSETALELVKRGHRLIADDAVEVRQTSENRLIGSAPELIQHLLEIRGLGIVNVMTLFGAGAVRSYKKITLVVQLEVWDPNTQYDRLGLDEQRIRILDTDLPRLVIPVRPGRNLAVLVEVAAMNYRLKLLGYNAPVHFSQKLMESIEEEEI